MSERIIVILETIAIVILAVVVVIYAQVLWQRFQSGEPVVDPSAEAALEVDTESESDVTEEQRLKVLESLSETGTETVTLEERKEILEQLAPTTETSEAEEAERLKILESLQGS